MSWVWSDARALCSEWARAGAVSIVPRGNAVLRWNGALPSALSGTTSASFQLMPTGAVSGATSTTGAPAKAACDPVVR